MVGKVSDQSGNETVLRFDSTGGMTTDSWTGMGIQYFGNGVWLGLSAEAANIFSAASFALGNAIWPEPHGDPEAQNTSGNEIDLVWCLNGSCGNLSPGNPDQDVPFIYYQDNPQYDPATRMNLTPAQISLVQRNAINALGIAYASYNVHIGNGRQGGHTVFVVGEDGPGAACGATAPLNQTTSRVYYPSNLDQLQFALNYQLTQPTDTMLEQLGEGIGNNAAHEVGHQLVTTFAASGKIINGMDMDDHSSGTYNGGSCADAAVFTGMGIHWDPSAATSLTNIFGPRQ